MKQTRGSLYLLTGLILGIALGLVYAWMIHPVAIVDTKPHSLQASFKDQYRSQIATAFVATGDLVRARARLELLGDENPYQTVVDQAEHMAVMGETAEVTALRLLATALNQNPFP
jgi:hypothetical protein